MTLDELGRPMTTTGYALCVFDSRGLALHADVPPGGTCGKKPCWKSTRTHRFSDKSGAHDGITGLILKPGVVATTMVSAKGKGADLTDPSRLPLLGAVTAQTVDLESGACFAATFAGSDQVKRNDGTRFKAKK